MARYSTIPIITTSSDPKRRYTTVKYPEIPFDFSDVYVYVTRGDRYDILAQSYYGDSSLWWIISRANYNLPQDSLVPPFGFQIRIPGANRVATIIANYENLNKNI
jgi:hypothetical protein